MLTFPGFFHLPCSNLWICKLAEFRWMSSFFGCSTSETKALAHRTNMETCIFASDSLMIVSSLECLPEHHQDEALVVVDGRWAPRGKFCSTVSLTMWTSKLLCKAPWNKAANLVNFLGIHWKQDGPCDFWSFSVTQPVKQEGLAIGHASRPILSLNGPARSPQTLSEIKTEKVFQKVEGWKDFLNKTQ